MTTKNAPPKMALPRTPNHANNRPNNDAEQDFLAASTALRAEKASPQMRVGAAVTAIALGIGLNFLGAPHETALQLSPAQTVEQ